MTDYERLYREAESVCGEPFEEFVNFFAACEKPLCVLDLGCGQGRDSLMAASYGHSVIGVDASKTGVMQVNKIAKKRGLDVCASVEDLCSYSPVSKYDVVVLDRIVHMMKEKEQKLGLLEMAQCATKARGYVLIADIPSNVALIEHSFTTGWNPVLSRRNTRFYRRVA